MISERPLMNRDYFRLSEQQFARLEPLLPTNTQDGLPVVDRRAGGITT
ncbi:hypothetical protein [Mesorhizobium sp.]|nr:hypothetical protein [Mesorhizobium sp.]